jgi:hypothetical protein
MHTEHLQNVRGVQVLAGWLIAIAVTSLVILALVGFGVLADAMQVSTFWSVLAVAAGFWAGGFFAGFRALQAPILHGIGIGLMSLVVWVVVNAVFSLLLPEVDWQGLTPALAVALVLAQMAAAVVGGLLGYNIALRGRPGLSEHEPINGFTD